MKDNKLVLSIAGSIIGILLMMNAYWLSNLVTTIASLDKVVNELIVIVEVHKESTKTHANAIANHELRLDCLEKDVAVLKSDEDDHSKDK